MSPPPTRGPSATAINKNKAIVFQSKIRYEFFSRQEAVRKSFPLKIRHTITQVLGDVGADVDSNFVGQRGHADRKPVILSQLVQIGR